MVSSFPENVQNSLYEMNDRQSTVLVASSVCVDSVKYSADMVVSVGSCSGFPDFRMITKIVVINTNIVFVCRLMTAWYNEHLRAYELCGDHISTFLVTHLGEKRHSVPLSVYSIRGRQLVTLKKVYLVLSNVGNKSNFLFFIFFLQPH